MIVFVSFIVACTCNSLKQSAEHARILPEFGLSTSCREFTHFFCSLFESKQLKCENQILKMAITLTLYRSCKVARRCVYPPHDLWRKFPPQSHRPSLFYGVRFKSMGKLQAQKARRCDCRGQEAPRG